MLPKPQYTATWWTSKYAVTAKNVHFATHSTFINHISVLQYHALLFQLNWHSCSTAHGIS